MSNSEEVCYKNGAETSEGEIPNSGTCVALSESDERVLSEKEDSEPIESCSELSVEAEGMQSDEVFWEMEESVQAEGCVLNADDECFTGDWPAADDETVFHDRAGTDEETASNGEFEAERCSSPDWVCAQPEVNINDECCVDRPAVDDETVFYDRAGTDEETASNGEFEGERCSSPDWVCAQPEVNVDDECFVEDWRAVDDETVFHDRAGTDEETADNGEFEGERCFNPDGICAQPEMNVDDECFVDRPAVDDETVVRFRAVTDEETASNGEFEDERCEDPDEVCVQPEVNVNDECFLEDRPAVDDETVFRFRAVTDEETASSGEFERCENPDDVCAQLQVNVEDRCFLRDRPADSDETVFRFRAATDEETVDNGELEADEVHVQPEVTVDDECFFGGRPAVDDETVFRFRAVTDEETADNRAFEIERCSDQIPYEECLQPGVNVYDECFLGDWPAVDDETEVHDRAESDEENGEFEADKCSYPDEVAEAETSAPIVIAVTDEETASNGEFEANRCSNPEEVVGVVPLVDIVELGSVRAGPFWSMDLVREVCLQSNIGKVLLTDLSNDDSKDGQVSSHALETEVTVPCSENPEPKKEYMADDEYDVDVVFEACIEDEPHEESALKSEILPEGLQHATVVRGLRIGEYVTAEGRAEPKLFPAVSGPSWSTDYEEVDPETLQDVLLLADSNSIIFVDGSEDAEAQTSPDSMFDLFWPNVSTDDEASTAFPDNGGGDWTTVQPLETENMLDWSSDGNSLPPTSPAWSQDVPRWATVESLAMEYLEEMEDHLTLLRNQMANDLQDDGFGSSVDEMWAESGQGETLQRIMSPLLSDVSRGPTPMSQELHSSVNLSDVYLSVSEESGPQVWKRVYAEGTSMRHTPESFKTGEGDVQPGPSWMTDSVSQGKSLFRAHLEDMRRSWQLTVGSLWDKPGSKYSPRADSSVDGSSGALGDGSWRSKINDHFCDLVFAYHGLRHTFLNFYSKVKIEDRDVRRNVQRLRNESSLALEYYDEILCSLHAVSNRFFRELRLSDYIGAAPQQNPDQGPEEEQSTQKQLSAFLSFVLRHLQDLLTSFQDFLGRFRELWYMEDGAVDLPYAGTGAIVLGHRRGSLLYEHIVDMKRSWSLACFNFWKMIIPGAANSVEGQRHGRFGHTITVRSPVPPTHRSNCFFRGYYQEPETLPGLRQGQRISELLRLLMNIANPSTLTFHAPDDTVYTRDNIVVPTADPNSLGEGTSTQETQTFNRNSSVVRRMSDLLKETQVQHRKRSRRLLNVLGIWIDAARLRWVWVYLSFLRMIRFVSSFFRSRMVALVSFCTGRSYALKTVCCDRCTAVKNYIHVCQTTLRESERLAKFRGRVQYFADLVRTLGTLFQAKFSKRFPRTSNFFRTLLFSLTGFTGRYVSYTSDQATVVFRPGLLVRCHEYLFSNDKNCHIADDVIFICQEPRAKCLVTALLFGFAVLADVVSASFLPGLCAEVSESKIGIEELMSTATLSQSVLSSLRGMASSAV